MLHRPVFYSVEKDDCHQNDFKEWTPGGIDPVSWPVTTDYSTVWIGKIAYGWNARMLCGNNGDLDWKNQHLRFHVPPTTPPGFYTGHVTLTPRGDQPVRVKVSPRVLPIALQKPEGMVWH